MSTHCNEFHTLHSIMNDQEMSTSIIIEKKSFYGIFLQTTSFDDML